MFINVWLGIMSSGNIFFTERSKRVVVYDFLSLCHHIQTSSEANPASYPLGTVSSFPRGKVTRE
jgi:hypothetical protein